MTKLDEDFDLQHRLLGLGPAHVLQRVATSCDPRRAMKHCPQCKRTYDDSSLNFCLEDGSQLTFFDTEAETLKNAPRKAEMSPQDVQMEIANFLKSTVAPGREALIRFDEITSSLGLTTKQINENIKSAAEAADCEIEQTETRATVRRNPTRLVRA